MREGQPSPQSISIFILADIRLYREGLLHVLGQQESIRVVGVAGEPSRGIEEIEHLRPDIIVFHLAVANALPALRAVVAAASGAKVVALGVPEAEQGFLAYAETGVAGFITVEESLTDLICTIRSVAEGEVPCSPRMSAILLQRVAKLAAERAEHGNARLTSRELEIVRLIDRGLSNKQIARQLLIKVPTVKNHIHNILEKLQVRGRVEAAAWVRTRIHGVSRASESR